MFERKLPGVHPGYTFPAGYRHGTDVGGPTTCATSAASVTGRTSAFEFSAIDSTGGNDEY